MSISDADTNFSAEVGVKLCSVYCVLDLLSSASSFTVMGVSKKL